MKNEGLILAADFGIEESKAAELTSALGTILKEREALINAYEDVITMEINEETIPAFKELRLSIRDNRTKGIEKWHKVNKEFFLTGGRFVDAIKNKEVEVNERMEEMLLNGEKHFENIEKERLLIIKKNREEIIAPFGYDFGAVDLSAMDEKMFEMILTGAKKTHEDKIIAEQKAELERVEAARLEAERLEAQRLENERLKVENEIKEKQIELERVEAAKREAELKAKADAEAKKQAEFLAKQKAESDAALKIEADKLAAVQAELKAKANAEAKVLKDAAEKLAAEKLAADKLAKASDKVKLSAWINSFSIGAPSFENDVTKDIVARFEGFKKWATEQVGSMK